MGRLVSTVPLFRQYLRPGTSKWVCQSCKRHQSVQAHTKPFYITTPIFYVNADPHVGHLYSMILADVLKRFQTLRGRTAFLSTGTDEHGLKVQKAAQLANLSPQELCDREAQTFKRLAERANISYDMFVRTTSPSHVRAVDFAWRKLRNLGFIYQTKHQGWYCVSDETFYPESAVKKLVDPVTGVEQMVSTETGKTVEWASEVNYKFTLSEFQDKLLAFYAANPSWIEPRTRMNFIIREVESGLKDLSVSRPSERVQWGIPVPDDPSQTIYVWLDALMNYAVQAGYPWTPRKATAGGWPADVQVIGKDIIRFHCIYWPAFLMALDIPCPQKFLCHAHWTLGHEKMSKSVGNVVDPFEAMDIYGRDAIRWYMSFDGGILDDSDYSSAIISARYQNLKNVLGNFTSRLTRSKKWSLQREVSVTFEMGKESERPTGNMEQELFDAMSSIRQEIEDAINQANPRLAAQAVDRLISKGNSSFAHFSPWKLGVNNDPEVYPPEGREAIYLCGECLRISGILLQPFMPDKAHELLQILGVKPERRTWDFAQIGADDHYGKGHEAAGTGKSLDGLLFPPLST